MNDLWAKIFYYIKTFFDSSTNSTIHGSAKWNERKWELLNQSNN